MPRKAMRPLGVRRKGPRVLIGVPVQSRSGLPDYRTQWCLDALKEQTECRVEVFCVGGNQISETSSIIVQKAIDEGWEYLLRTDADMTFPPNALDRLVARDKDIVGGLCTRKWPPYKPCAASESEGRWKAPTVSCDMVEREECIRYDAVGTGFLLIKRRVLLGIDSFLKDKVYPSVPKEYESFLAAPWFPVTYNPKTGKTISSDFSFCKMARMAGFDAAWLDCGVVCGHQGEGEFDIRDYWSWTKNYGDSPHKPLWPGQEVVHAETVQ